MNIYNLYVDCYGNYDENASVYNFSSYEKALDSILTNVQNKKVIIERDVDSQINYENAKALIRVTVLDQLGEIEPYEKYHLTCDKTLHYRLGTIYEIIEGKLL